MIEALLGELAVSGGTEVVTAAGEHLAEKIKKEPEEEQCQAIQNRHRKL